MVDGKYMSEVMHLNKPAWNSHRKDITPNWEILFRYFGQESYDWFTSMMNKFLKFEVTSLPVTKFREIYMTNKTPDFHRQLLKELTNRKLLGFVRYLNNPSDAGFMTQNDRIRIVNIRSIANINKLNGKILVPVEDNDIKRLENHGKGSATLLDGGFVYISKLVDGSEISNSNYIKVGDISTRKTKQAK